MPFLPQDIVKIELRQEYLGEEIVNTIFYRIAEVVAGAVVQTVWNTLIDALLDAIEALQSTSLSHVEQVVDNLTDGVSTALITDTRNGTSSGLDVAAFVAAGWKKSVDSKITRPGSFRLAGLIESQIEGNNLTSTMTSACETAGLFLGGTQIVDDGTGNIVTFEPVVVGRALDGSFDLARINSISTFNLPRLTTQNSRKPKR